MKAVWVKAITGSDVTYFSSLGECCKTFDIRYKELLLKLIDEGGVAPDGRTFFDWPTDYEIEQLERSNKIYEQYEQGKGLVYEDEEIVIGDSSLS